MSILRVIKSNLKILLPVRGELQNYSSERVSQYITISLQRSGQHAVISWLCYQLGNTLHYNHCWFERRGKLNWVTPINNRIIHYHDGDIYDSGVQDAKEMSKYLLSIRSFENVLYSFEDLDIKHKLLRKYVHTQLPTVILILRDPYNWLASSLKHKKSSRKQLIAKRDYFIRYMEQTLGEHDYLDYPVTAINYNKWLSDFNYRKRICDSLNIPYRGEPSHEKQAIQDFGGGSSFDGLAIDKEKLLSNVLRRWEKYRNDEFFNETLQHDHLIKLTELFFNLKKPF